MKICPLNTNHINFGAKYKTSDVLCFVTNYDFKRNTDNSGFFKSITGVDGFSSSIVEKFEKKYDYGSAYIGLWGYVVDKVLQQCPKLQKPYEEFDCDLRFHKTKQERKDWFSAQIGKLPKYTEIEPIQLNEDEIDEYCRDIHNIFMEL